MKLQQGFTIVEIIIVVAVILTAFGGILQVAQFSSRAESQAHRQTKAHILAREAFEATRFVRDENWSAFAALSFDARYYPVLEGNAWTLSPSNPGTVDGFQRWIEIREVYRDNNQDIAPSGTADPDTRNIAAYVEWIQQGGDIKTIQLETYLTNW